MPGEEFAKRLVVLEPNKILRAIYLALLIGGPLVLLGAVTGVSPLGFFGIHLAIVGGFLYASHRRYNQRAKKVEHAIRATSEGVFVDGKLVVRAPVIADGFYQPRRQWQKEKYQSSVRLVDKRRNIVFEAEMPDETEALGFLHALGLDPGSRRAEFRGGSPLYATLGRQLGSVVGGLGVLMAIGAITSALDLNIGTFEMFLFVPMMIAAMRPSKITVGVDGILIRWLWTKKFIPMKEIRAVSEADDNAIRIILRNFEERIVYTSMRMKQSASVLMQNNRDAILARIREAHAMYSATGGAADAAALVARGDQKKSEWLAALQKLARAEGGYRDVVVRTEDLLRVVEDPHAAEDARAGAAFVLRTSADEEAKARVRVAAQASASPKLRVALDAAALDDEEKIEEAIAQLVPEEARRQAT